MLTRLALEPYSLIGLSVGGVYTSILCPELSVIFDAGISPRSFVGAKHLLVSHGHADHVGSLPSMIGLRGLAHQPPPDVKLPEEIAEDVEIGLRHFNSSQRRVLEVHFQGLAPGDEFQLGPDLFGRAFRTLHSVPSLGYLLFRRVQKLKPEYLGLAGEEVRKKKEAGEALFEAVERPQIAYVTDTLVDVLDQNPELYRVPTLILECTFLDASKSRDEARQKSHIHLDEIIERAALFENEHLVLMHFSQSYQPKEVHRIVEERLPSELAKRVRVFAPRSGMWPG